MALHQTTLLSSVGWPLACNAHTSWVQRVDGWILQRDDSDAVGADVNGSSWLSHDCKAQCLCVHTLLAKNTVPAVLVSSAGHVMSV